jgi:curved DNA-binding protein
VSAPAFADHYEALQLSPSADQETIERVFRLLAKRYHPDNNASGDADRFNQILEAYETLSDSSARAAYDVRHEAENERRWQIRREGMSGNHRAEDEELFGTPREHLEFPLWYLRQRRLVEVLDSGLWAITVAGIDELGSKELSLPEDRLLAPNSGAGVSPEEPLAIPQGSGVAAVDEKVGASS